MDNLTNAELKEHAETTLVWQAREWVMFCAKTIEALAPYFWRDLIASVKRITFEECGLPERAFWENSPRQFHVHQPLIPSFDVTVTLNVDAHTVRYVTEQRASREVDPVRAERKLVFHLDDAGKLYLKRGEIIFNVDGAARMLLEPLLNRK